MNEILKFLNKREDVILENIPYYTIKNNKRRESSAQLKNIQNKAFQKVKVLGQTYYLISAVVKYERGYIAGMKLSNRKGQTTIRILVDVEKRQ